MQAQHPPPASWNGRPGQAPSPSRDACHRTAPRPWRRPSAPKPKRRT